MCAGGLMFLAPEIMTLLVGTADVISSAQALQSLALIYGIYSVFVCSCCFMFGIGRPDVVAPWTLLGPGLAAPVMYVTASEFGLAGAFWSNSASLLIIIVTVHLCKLIRLPISQAFGMYGPALVSLLACFAVSRHASYHRLPFSIHLTFACVALPVLLIYVTSWAPLLRLYRELTSFPFPTLLRRGGLLPPELKPVPVPPPEGIPFR